MDEATVCLDAPDRERERSRSQISPGNPSLKSAEFAACSAYTDSSTSPRELLVDMQLSDTPIIPINITPTNIPSQVQLLFQDLEEISQGVKIVPRQVEGKMKDIRIEVRELWLTDEGDGYGNTEPEVLDAFASFDEAYTVQRITSECYERMASEASWNSEVHSSLLRLALHCHHKAKGIWY